MMVKPVKLSRLTYLKVSFLHIIPFLLFFSGSSIASDTLVLDDKHEALEIRGTFTDVLEDPTRKLTIDDVLLPVNNRFKTGGINEIQKNDNINSVYWVRMVITNNSTLEKNWVVELFDFRIDYIEAYFQDKEGNFKRKITGAQFPFYSKDYKHKNFIYDLPQRKGVPQTIYFKISANRPVSLIGIVRTYQRFAEYSNREYFYLALFYGTILAMTLYNLFLFTAIHDRTYLYYALYVMTIGVYALSQDGLGFQYIWYNHPAWNDFVFPVSNYWMIIWALFYARSFLNTELNFPGLDKGILLLLILRTLIFITWMFYPAIAYREWIDVFILFYIYVAGIISWMQGFKTARFYVLAFTLFFLGFLLTILEKLGFIYDNAYTVYCFNFGVLCEMFLLALALADRIKMLTKDKEKAQEATIEQYKENEALKDKLNRELEEKVLERTRELDAFVYRSSHDIKGPIKSIIGLTSVAMKDSKDPVSHTYFEHILKSSKRLDTVVGQLMNAIQAKDSRLEFSLIHFDNILSDILSGLEGLPDFPYVKISTTLNQDEDFYSDEKLLYSILQNLIENAIKYRDPVKADAFLRIDIEVKAGFAVLEFTDNGTGIDKVSQKKIFELFYKVREDSNGHGLGLYMTRTHVEKLGGSVILKSEPGEGSCFRINLKNNKQ
jgi:signal transduction histidine kinase